MKKGEHTRNLILDEAVALASQVGLEGLSIGSLASRLDLSKSGLFAHFGSKEDLQLSTLRQAQRLFRDRVFSPALKEPRGLPRLRALLSGWLAWIAQDNDLSGSSLVLSASAEYDDRPGAVRELLVSGQRELRGAIVKAIHLAIEEGHLAAPTDPWQLSFELFGIVLATHHDRRLLDDTRSVARAQNAIERLFEAHRSVPSA
ncbi:MAG TPA: TetR/AcrR family transcriptional regulator [Burkholderiales bacterium]|nr:TetR/AcrR family transcriptional regulator [Burkholderiales bacterium]